MGEGTVYWVAWFRDGALTASRQYRTSGPANGMLTRWSKLAVFQNRSTHYIVSFKLDVAISTERGITYKTTILKDWSSK